MGITLEEEKGIIISNVTYEDIPFVLENFYEQDIYDYEFRIKSERDIILVRNPAFRVTDKKLIFMEGIYCTYSAEYKDWLPDWSLTLIYEDKTDSEFDYTEYTYFEQDSPEITIHNFLKMMDL